MPAAWMIHWKSGIGVGSGTMRSRASTVRFGVPASAVSHAGVPRMKLSHTVSRMGWRRPTVLLKWSTAWTR